MREDSDTIVRQATISDLDLLIPLFDAYRQFYQKPMIPILRFDFPLSGSSTASQLGSNDLTSRGHANHVRHCQAPKASNYQANIYSYAGR